MEDALEEHKRHAQACAREGHVQTVRAATALPSRLWHNKLTAN